MWILIYGHNVDMPNSVTCCFGARLDHTIVRKDFEVIKVNCLPL